MISEEVRTEYWNHFTDESHRVFRPKKITDVRLKFIKKDVLDDNTLWQKLFSRQREAHKTPSELLQTSPSDYRHARTGFWELIRGKIHRQTLELNELSGGTI